MTYSLMMILFQADADRSGQLEYEEFMQIVTGKTTATTSKR